MLKNMLKNQKIKVIVIGGGHAGMNFIKELNKSKLDIDLVLIDAKDFFEVNYVNLWELVSPKELPISNKKKYDKLTKATIINHKVISISKTNIELDTHEILSYDFLILASGSSYPSLNFAKSPAYSTIEDIQNNLNEEAKAIAKSNSILIIGGGAVGVELAGEIIERYPNKKVSLVHGQSRLLNNLDKKASEIAYNLLQNKGVEIFLNERIEISKTNPNIFESLKSDRTFSADKVYKAFGVKVNTDYMMENFQKTLTDHGFINVDHYMRVKGTTNIFAIGDIIATQESKQGIVAANHGKYLGKIFPSIIKHYQNLENSDIEPYTPKKLITLIPVGKKAGLIQIGNKAFKSKLIGKLKHSKMFIKKVIKAIS